MWPTQQPGFLLEWSGGAVETVPFSSLAQEIGFAPNPLVA
jgi:hypothetical protein